MHKFIVRILFSILGAVIVYSLSYFAVDLAYNSKSSENSLFIWGDSQTYQGLDLDILRDKTSKKIYTAAYTGAGMYSFLVFAEKVPPDSDVLIAFPTLLQIRKKDHDNNESSISLSAMRLLLKNNYSWNECLEIFKTNKAPHKIFTSKTYTFPYSGDVTFEKETFDGFKKAYESVSSYLIDKQNLYIEGVKRLREKNCRVCLIVFPCYKLLEEMEKNSPVKKLSDDFLVKVQKEANCEKSETLYLDDKKQVMHDLTHLNGYGAKQVSAFVGQRINDCGQMTFIIANGEQKP